jgi:hypothetical protein
MGDQGRVTAFCSSGCNICWKVNSSISFFILGMQWWKQMLLEIVLSICDLFATTHLSTPVVLKEKNLSTLICLSRWASTLWLPPHVRASCR